MRSRGRMLELISSESSPTADLGPDLRPDRGHPIQRGWWAPVAQYHIRGSGGHGLKVRGSPSRHPTPNPSRSRGRHCQRREAHCRHHFATGLRLLHRALRRSVTSPSTLLSSPKIELPLVYTKRKEHHSLIYTYMILKSNRWQPSYSPC
jgi:hypothetical protein